jgi:hypothetical protein
MHIVITLIHIQNILWVKCSFLVAQCLTFYSNSAILLCFYSNKRTFTRCIDCKVIRRPPASLRDLIRRPPAGLRDLVSKGTVLRSENSSWRNLLRRNMLNRKWYLSLYNSSKFFMNNRCLGNFSLLSANLICFSR